MANLLIDAMNVIGSRPDGWWKDRDKAVRHLVRQLQSLAVSTGDEVVAVLDGRPLSGLPEGLHSGIRVEYARGSGRDAADDRIVEHLAKHLVPQQVTVVTSDRELKRRVRKLSASVMPPAELFRIINELDVSHEGDCR